MSPYREPGEVPPEEEKASQEEKSPRSRLIGAVLLATPFFALAHASACSASADGVSFLRALQGTIGGWGMIAIGAVLVIYFCFVFDDLEKSRKKKGISDER